MTTSTKPTREETDKIEEAHRELERSQDVIGWMVDHAKKEGGTFDAQDLYDAWSEAAEVNMATRAPVEIGEAYAAEALVRLLDPEEE